MNTLLLSLVKVEVLPLADVLSILNLGDKSACFINPLVPDCNLKYVFFSFLTLQPNSTDSFITILFK